MKFKTVEWTIALAAAPHMLSIHGYGKIARHVDDLHAWLLLHLHELEHLPPPAHLAQPPAPAAAKSGRPRRNAR